MRFEKCWQIDPPAKGFFVASLLSLIFWAWLAIMLACLLCSCSTVAPRPPVDSVASWDGTNQNSGFIGWAPDGQGIITEQAKARYDGLVAQYGSRFNPPLTNSAGLRPCWLIDQEHLVKFGTMNRWRKAGQ